jgi:lipopolysaccharide transport system permease protein
MFIYYIVFALLLKSGGENYPVFLLTGLIPWMWFMKAVSGSSNSIIAGQNLMLQVGLPSIIFPLVSLLQATLKQMPVFILLLGFVWLQNYTPGAHWWGLIPVIIVQALLTIAFACMVAAVIPFIRDLSYLVPTGLTLLMFLSGIFYDYKSISENWQELFLLNPMAFLLKCYREILIDGVMPDLVTLMYWGLGSIAACLLLLLAYKRLRYVYPRIVME